MHALRRRTVLVAVDALIAGRRLVLIDLARAWPKAERIRAPLKRLDRLLRNDHLHAARGGKPGSPFRRRSQQGLLLNVAARAMSMAIAAAVPVCCSSRSRSD
jgi:hypothetical protein